MSTVRRRERSHWPRQHPACSIDPTCPPLYTALPDYHMHYHMVHTHHPHPRPLPACHTQSGMPGRPSPALIPTQEGLPHTGPGLLVCCQSVKSGTGAGRLWQLKQTDQQRLSIVACVHASSRRFSFGPPRPSCLSVTALSKVQPVSVKRAPTLNPSRLPLLNPRAHYNSTTTLVCDQASRTDCDLVLAKAQRPP